MSGPRLFSRLYDPVMELPEHAGLGELRRGVLRGLRGRILELGIGTGRNLPLYGAGVDSLNGIDPDEAMLVPAERRAGDVPFPVELVATPAEELPFGDGSFDAVVSTLVFCTVRDPSRALGEVRRVLQEASSASWSTCGWRRSPSAGCRKRPRPSGSRSPAAATSTATLWSRFEGRGLRWSGRSGTWAGWG